MNTLQHEENNIAFKLEECSQEKKSNKQIGDLKSTQNDVINTLQHCWKPIKY